MKFLLGISLTDDGHKQVELIESTKIDDPAERVSGARIRVDGYIEPGMLHDFVFIPKEDVDMYLLPIERHWRAQLSTARNREERWRHLMLTAISLWLSYNE